MGRPPIIISNGGVIDALTNGLSSTTKLTVIEQLKDNVKKLNTRSNERNEKFSSRPIIREIISSEKKEDPTILWCLADEDIVYLKSKLNELGCKDPHAELSG